MLTVNHSDICGVHYRGGIPCRGTSRQVAMLPYVVWSLGPHWKSSFVCAYFCDIFVILLGLTTPAFRTLEMTMDTVAHMTNCELVFLCVSLWGNNRE